MKDLKEELMDVIESLYQRLEERTPKAKRAEIRSEAQSSLATLREKLRDQENLVDERHLGTASILGYQGIL